MNPPLTPMPIWGARGFCCLVHCFSNSQHLEDLVVLGGHHRTYPRTYTWFVAQGRMGYFIFL